jgi:hypothetical protein
MKSGRQEAKDTDRIAALAAELATVDKRLRGVDERIRAMSRVLDRVALDTGGRGLRAHAVRAEHALRALLLAHHLEADQLPYPERLTAQRFRVLSQNEEDGILLALLREAGIGPRSCVEVGCGTNGGCTGFLVDELGFRGLMLDGHEPNVEAVRRRFNPELVTAEQAWITREGIDAIIQRNGFEGEIDVLSIDIDGVDLWVWEAIRVVDPRIVIIEYNSMMGPDRAVTIPYDPEFRRRSLEGTKGLYYGASLTALSRVATRRGYRLVCTDHRGVNAFFLRDDVAADVPAVAPRRAFRLMEKYRSALERGVDFDAIVAELDLRLVEID